MSDAARNDLTGPAPIAVRRIGANLGAEIRGVDLGLPLPPTTFAAIEAALVEHEVLIFPGQRITAEQQKAFGRMFGELTVHPFAPSDGDAPELIIFDNDEKNPPWGTDMWHSDETFRAEPPMGTMLRSLIVPAIGGDTLFASMSAAYEGLSERMQQFLSGLEAVHDFKPFKTLFEGTEEGWRKMRHFEGIYRPVVHPVVRVHPITGKKALFVNPQFTLYIKGMGEWESRHLLEELFRTIFTLEYQYRHRWEPDMLVFWDNRWTQHAAVHDYYPQRRLMERVTIKGDRPFGTGEEVDAKSLHRRKVPSVMDFKNRPKRQHELK